MQFAYVPDESPSYELYVRNKKDTCFLSMFFSKYVGVCTLFDKC